jgi:hypothetical protein
MLNFDQTWRFQSPGAIGPDGVDAFFSLIGQIATQMPGQWVFERFTERFALAAGSPYYPSSNTRFAREDLESLMLQASENAPMFIEAFIDTTALLEKGNPPLAVPHISHVNELLVEHRIGYTLQPADQGVHHVATLARADGAIPIPVSSPPPSLGESAQLLIQKSLAESERLLAEGRDRQAVQEILWLLESLSTAFRGVVFEDRKVVGSYFNAIIRELRQAGKVRSIEPIFEWIQALHGYLSAPAGGGIRHGIDLRQGLPIDANQARLYCNLVRSYISFLMGEHERTQGTAILSK